MDCIPSFFSKEVVDAVLITDLVSRSRLFGTQSEVDPSFAFELEELAHAKRFKEMAERLDEFPQRACAMFMRANLEWLRDPTTTAAREIRLHKASAKRRIEGAMHSSWGEGPVTIADDGETLEAVIDVTFSNRDTDKRDKQIIRLRGDGSIQVVLLTWGGYTFSLSNPLCFNRQFFTGTMREVNGTSRVVILLDRSENGRSVVR